MWRELSYPATSRHIPPHPASGDENCEKYPRAGCHLTREGEALKLRMTGLAKGGLIARLQRG
jgi:hypothetical protein